MNFSLERDKARGRERERERERGRERERWWRGREGVLFKTTPSVEPG